MCFVVFRLAVFRRVLLGGVASAYLCCASQKKMIVYCFSDCVCMSVCVCVWVACIIFFLFRCFIVVASCFVLPLCYLVNIKVLCCNTKHVLRPVLKTTLKHTFNLCYASVVLFIALLTQHPTTYPQRTHAHWRCLGY